MRDDEGHDFAVLQMSTDDDALKAAEGGQAAVGLFAYRLLIVPGLLQLPGLLIDAPSGRRPLIPRQRA